MEGEGRLARDKKRARRSPKHSFRPEIYPEIPFFLAFEDGVEDSRGFFLLSGV